ncbi:hypothetical protein TREES_T100002458 [Tupaia chinensis]|uniref:Uncharacterized protein n=1 Tax=Tupaia chinensis TaxID=246437 RepID=L9LAF2_TUPCH|nr:hypothetical protein TREES_T100002458 [Tupaia chinensis]
MQWVKRKPLGTELVQKDLVINHPRKNKGCSTPIICSRYHDNELEWTLLSTLKSVPVDSDLTEEVQNEKNVNHSKSQSRVQHLGAHITKSCHEGSQEVPCDVSLLANERQEMEKDR